MSFWARSEGRNVRMEVRWAGDNVDRMRALAKELVDLQPDVILASNTPATAALQRETRMIPIVFQKAIYVPNRMGRTS
jgi:putative ABC transport system substrate-binding protein